MSKSNAPTFSTPEDAETAFYEAIQTSQLDALMAVWADDEEVVCVHPNGQRMVGHAAIRESWRAILASNRRLHIGISRSVRWTSMLMSVHSVIEHITIDGATPGETIGGGGGGGDGGTLTLAGTNVLLRGANGWRLLSHHSSAIQEQADSEPNGGPRVLH